MIKLSDSLVFLKLNKDFKNDDSSSMTDLRQKLENFKCCDDAENQVESRLQNTINDIQLLNKLNKNSNIYVFLDKINDSIELVGFLWLGAGVVKLKSSELKKIELPHNAYQEQGCVKIYGIAIDNKFKNKKYGNKLMDKAIKEIKNISSCCLNINVAVLDADNIDYKIEYYKKHGFMLTKENKTENSSKPKTMFLPLPLHTSSN